MNKKGFGGMGASSILMIFVVLILTTFGMLSFVTAQADLQLTEKNVDAVESYYEADAQADKIITEIDEIIFGIKNNSQRQNNNEDYLKSIGNATSQISSIKSIEKSVMNIIVDIDETRRLNIKLLIEPVDSSQRYQTISRQIEPTPGADTEQTGQWAIP